MSAALSELRLGARGLLRCRGLALAAVMVLGLGTGANIGIYSVVSSVLLQPLKFPQSERLMVLLRETKTKDGISQEGLVSPGDFLDWREQNRTLEEVAAVSQTIMTLRGGRIQLCSVGRASVDLFRLLGIQPVLGRGFDRTEDQLGGPKVAMLDAGFWLREFGGSPTVIGTTITLDNQGYTIIGIVPTGWRISYFDIPSVWLPLNPDRRLHGGGDLVVLGRLRPSISTVTAQADLKQLAQALAFAFPDDKDASIIVEPLHDWIVAEVKRPLVVLAVAVAIVLFMCCGTVANLMMTRAVSRRKEMAIRAALGAGRGSLVRSAISESAVIVALGCIFGLAVGSWLIAVISKVRSIRIPRIEEIYISHQIFDVALPVCIGSLLLIGLQPAIHALRTNLRESLQELGGRAQARYRKLHFRTALAITQIALAVILLDGAVLMIKSFLRLAHVDLGFHTSNITVIEVFLPQPKYIRTLRTDFCRELIRRLSSIPGAQTISACDHVLLEAVHFVTKFEIEGKAQAYPSEALTRHVAPNFLRVMGIHLVKGRDFDWSDEGRYPIPILVNQKLAQYFFGGENPIGKRLLTDLYGKKSLEIVGVIGIVRQVGLRPPPGPQIYLPLSYGSAHYVLVKTYIGQRLSPKVIQTVVHDLDPDVPIPTITSMDEFYSREIAQPRFYLVFLSAFAFVAITLAAVGIFSVMSYGVALRTREIGIRKALGAKMLDIVYLIACEWTVIMITGLSAGLAGSLVLAQVLSALLYGISPTDHQTLLIVCSVMGGVSIVATYVPMKRASDLDPATALRFE